MAIVEIKSELCRDFDSIDIDVEKVDELLASVTVAERDIETLAIRAIDRVKSQFGPRRIGIELADNSILGQYDQSKHEIVLAMKTIQDSVARGEAKEKEFNLTLLHELGHAAAYKLGIDKRPSRALQHIVLMTPVALAAGAAAKTTVETKSVSLGLLAGVASFTGTAILQTAGLIAVEKSAGSIVRKGEEIADRFMETYAPIYPALITVTHAPEEFRSPEPDDLISLLTRNAWSFSVPRP